MMTPAERTEKRSHLKAKMREMKVAFEEVEAALGGLTEDEKRALKGLACALEYHASNLKG